MCFPCPSQVKVLYGGTELFDDEVRHTFHNDMMLAVISGACITVLVYVLTSFSGTVRPVPYSTRCAHISVFELPYELMLMLMMFTSSMLPSRLSAVFLTFFGLASIGLSCLMALFLYHVVFGVRYLGILNGVAAFVIIGIGKGKEIHNVHFFSLKEQFDNLGNTLIHFLAESLPRGLITPSCLYVKMMLEPAAGWPTLA